MIIYKNKRFYFHLQFLIYLMIIIVVFTTNFNKLLENKNYILILVFLTLVYFLIKINLFVHSYSNIRIRGNKLVLKNIYGIEKVFNLNEFDGIFVNNYEEKYSRKVDLRYRQLTSEEQIKIVFKKSGKVIFMLSFLGFEHCWSDLQKSINSVLNNNKIKKFYIKDIVTEADWNNILRTNYI